MQRLSVIGCGVFAGALFAFLVAWQAMPQAWAWEDRAQGWAIIMAGPIVGTAWDCDFAALGWPAVLLLPAHPICPHWGLGLLTGAGLVLWFLSGWLTVIMAVWGA